MFKKLALILVASVIILNFSACTPNNNSNSQIFSDLTADTIPPLPEAKALPTDLAAELRLAMEKLPLDECEDMLSEQISTFCESDGVAEFVEVNLSKDTLSLVERKNKKPVENLQVEIKVEILPSNDPDFEAVNISREFFSRLNAFLRTIPYTAFLSKEVSILASYDGIDPLNSLKNSISYVSPIAFIEQPEEELAVQTVAYNFSKQNRDFFLLKFGAIPETGELYIEYYVTDDFLLDKKVKSDRQAALQQIYQEVKEKILDEEATEQYLRENNLTSLTVSFQNSFLEDGYMTFHEEL